MTEDETVGWHHQLDACELGQAPGDGEGQASLACCRPWGRKELETTWRLNSIPVSFWLAPSQGVSCIFSKTHQACFSATLVLGRTNQLASTVGRISSPTPQKKQTEKAGLFKMARVGLWKTVEWTCFCLLVMPVWDLHNLSPFFRYYSCWWHAWLTQSFYKQEGNRSAPLSQARPEEAPAWAQIQIAGPRTMSKINSVFFKPLNFTAVDQNSKSSHTNTSKGILFFLKWAFKSEGLKIIQIQHYFQWWKKI